MNPPHPNTPSTALANRYGERIRRSDKDAGIPASVRLASEWAWRTGVILLVAGALGWLLSRLSFLILPLMVATLLAALLHPVVVWLYARGLPAGLAVAITELGMLGLVAAALTLIGEQVAAGFSRIRGSALNGIGQVQDWLGQGPLHLSAAQIDTYVQDVTKALNNNTGSAVAGALTFGNAAGHMAAGTLLALFVLIFFLHQGESIWAFLVGLMPRRARPAIDGAGRRGWKSLVSYTRIQLLVACLNAVGIGVGAAVLGVPLALPLAVLVLLGSFIPVVGALLTGAVAVLLALAANGPVNALIMLAVVLLVHQIENHLLQPLVMGRAVALHPVAVILAVAAGSTVAGIPGALFAVPILAVTNSAVRYIAARGWEHDRTAADPDGPHGPGHLSRRGPRVVWLRRVRLRGASRG